MTAELRNAQWRTLRGALFSLFTVLPCVHPMNLYESDETQKRASFFMHQIVELCNSLQEDVVDASCSRGDWKNALKKMERLVACVQKRPDALCRLICFPWAGGGTLQLAQWSQRFNDSIEVFCIRFPGRETRLKEPFAKDMTSMANEVASVLLKELKEKPFAFFGHCFGSQLSFATALHLKEKYGLEPVHLFMSGASAPHSEGFLAIKSIPVSDAKDEEIIAYIKTLGGTPSELLHNEDIRKQMVLTFKEDIRVLQTVSFEKAERDPPFSCDITCFNGSDDKVGDVQAWQELTSGDTSFFELPGGHFYLLEPSNESFLTKHITRCIENAGL